jgi:hypothetical protein
MKGERGNFNIFWRRCTTWHLLHLLKAMESWMEGEDAAEEELRLLEAMAGVSTAMQQVRTVAEAP